MGTAVTLLALTTQRLIAGKSTSLTERANQMTDNGTIVYGTLSPQRHEASFEDFSQPKSASASIEEATPTTMKGPTLASMKKSALNSLKKIFSSSKGLLVQQVKSEHKFYLHTEMWAYKPIPVAEGPHGKT